MSKTFKYLLGALLIIGVIICYGIQYIGMEEVNEYKTPPPADDDFLADDKLDDKQTSFDPELIDSRPVDGWLINKSESVIKLDIPVILPDIEPQYLTLYPSYKEAVNAGCDILPSVNLIDGKAKQFDDGLYAALDQAYYQGVQNILESHISLIRRIYDKTDKNSKAASYLAAGLELADIKVPATDEAAKNRYLNDFNSDEVASKPIGFYTWSDTLKKCFRFMRFFQKEFALNNEIPKAIATVLDADLGLRQDYQKAVDFYSRLTNPSICLSVLDINNPVLPGRVSHRTVAVFPPSTARETVLFEMLFPEGIPPDINLMKELIKRIKSGEVNLAPDKDSGWYEYQVYALETLLLPEKGEERNKLLLTKSYKKRMLEAFKALITKRRETHVRQLATPQCKVEILPPQEILPQLRIEPCPSYYIRTARAYAFLQNFLQASVGETALNELHGLKKDGQRKMSLGTELNYMKELFYGFYLIACEDIGLKPAFLKDETVEPKNCYDLANNWLNSFKEDDDLAQDTRVSVPIARNNDNTRIWATLGVRLARLDAIFVRPPRIKPQNKGEGPGDWKEVNPWTLGQSHYQIAVDEFAEFELSGSSVLSREELRVICDKYKTKEEILKALGGSN